MKKIIPLVLVLVIGLSGCSGLRSIIEEDFSFAEADFARVDGNVVTVPLSEAIASVMLEDESFVISHSNTREAITNVVNGKKDIAIITFPGEDELKVAEEKEVDLTITPIASDAFVFFVGKDNKVNNLTSEQLRDIFSGKIKDWKEVGGNVGPISAYQRQKDSGSQTGMLKFMGDSELLPVPMDYVVTEMGELTSKIADPDSANNSIGYSYHYYVNNIYVRDSIKLLKVDGFEPTSVNIRNEKYPIVETYYAITRTADKEDSFGKRFLRYLLSGKGQRVLEDSGYVGVQ